MYLMYLLVLVLAFQVDEELEHFIFIAILYIITMHTSSFCSPDIQNLQRPSKCQAPVMSLGKDTLAISVASPNNPGVPNLSFSLPLLQISTRSSFPSFPLF